MILSLTALAWAVEDLSVYVETPVGFVELALGGFPLIEGTVAYEGPIADDGTQNWKTAHHYRGVSVAAILEAAGDLASYETMGIVAIDGWAKRLTERALSGTSDAGVPILAIERNGESGEDWEDGPMLVFLPEDERFSNDDMLNALGADLAHYFGEVPSTTGMMVKGVTYLIPDYDGRSLPLQPETVPLGQTSFPDEKILSVIRGDAASSYTLEDVEAFETLEGAGTFTTSTNAEYTATYVGIPMTTLIGNVSAEATVRVTAADGYSMNYPASQFQDTSEGTWILAYKENGEYMPFDPGYFRIVQVGDDTPHFSSALSAKMVTLIEVLGSYVNYSLTVTGAVERMFARSELEEGIGCPCHSNTVSVTSKGVTSQYTGIPLWRLVAYVDDDVFPAPELGIHYNDEDFNDALAGGAYEITLVAEDGYSQTVTSDLIARDDRFIIAFKQDGIFLDPAASGFMRFVYDDSVTLPEGMNLRSVKFLTELLVDL